MSNTGTMGTKSITGWAAAMAFLMLAWMGGGRALADSARNACGCYQGESGTCYCDRKAKCGCPGECEPIGCEAARQKALDKEIQEEMRKAEGASRGREERDTHEAKQPKVDQAPASEAPRPKKVNAAAPKPAARLTPAQRQELRRLLDVYLGEHPGDAGKSVGQLRRDVASGTP